VEEALVLKKRIHAKEVALYVALVPEAAQNESRTLFVFS